MKNTGTVVEVKREWGGGNCPLTLCWYTCLVWYSSNCFVFLL